MGFGGAMSTMMWGLSLIMVLLMIWSILCVEFVWPVARVVYKDSGFLEEQCGMVFSSVIQTTLHLFQTLVAGDSWGSCTVPLIHHTPSLSILFFLALASVHLGFTNLVLATIVDRAAEAREDSRERKKELQLQKERESIELWRDTMKKMDEDCSGFITEDELLKSFHHQEDVKDVLGRLQIREDDLQTLFHLIDMDENEKVSSDEFCNAFHKAYTQDWRGYMMIVKLNLESLSRNINRRVGGLEDKLDDLMIERRSSVVSGVSGVTDTSTLITSRVLPARNIESDSAACESDPVLAVDRSDREDAVAMRSPPPLQSGSPPPLQSIAEPKTMSPGCLDWAYLRQKLDVESDDKVVQDGTAGGQPAKPLYLSARCFAPPAQPAAAPPVLRAAGAPGAGGAVAGAATGTAATVRGSATLADSVMDTRLIAELHNLHRGLEAQLEALVADAAATTEVLMKQGRLLRSVGKAPATLYGASEYAGDGIPTAASTPAFGSGTADARTRLVNPQRPSTTRLEATLSVTSAELGYRHVSTAGLSEEMLPHTSISNASDLRHLSTEACSGRPKI